MPHPSARPDPASRAGLPLAAPAPAGRWGAAEAWLVGMAVAALYLALGPDPVRTLGTMYDDVVYLSLGKAIATGHGYHSLHMVGGPVHEKFPPGLPALYALLWLAGGTLDRTVWLVYLSTVAALGGAAAILWRYSRAVLANGRLTTLLLVALPLALPRSMRYFSGAASEPWFVLCWAGALALTHRATESAGRRRLSAAIALGLVLAAAAFVRTQGVVLLPAVLLALLVRRADWRVVAATLVAALAPLLAWRLALARMVAAGPVATQPDQVSYTTWIPHGSVAAFAGFLRQVLRVNGPGYAGTAVEVLAGWNSPKVALLLVGVLALAVAGMVRAGRRRPELWTTLGVNLAVVLLWPFLQDRFAVALMPFVGLATAYGLGWLLDASWLPAPRATRAAALALSAAMALYLAVPLGTGLLAAARGRRPADATFSPVFQARSLAVAEWVRANTDSSARVMTELGGGVWLRTGRRTVIALPEEPFVGPSVMRPPGRYVAERILVDSVTHVVAWRHTAPALVAHLGVVRARCPGVLEEVAPHPAPGTPMPTWYFRVHRDEGCLRSLVDERGEGK